MKTNLKSPWGAGKFPWGATTNIHAIGEYEIVEYRDLAGNACFHPYISGEDTNHSYNSLDAAIVGAIGLKHDGLNSQAASYFMKMIGAKP